MKRMEGSLLIIKSKRLRCVHGIIYRFYTVRLTIVVVYTCSEQGTHWEQTINKFTCFVLFRELEVVFFSELEVPLLVLHGSFNVTIIIILLFIYRINAEHFYD